MSLFKQLYLTHVGRVQGIVRRVGVADRDVPDVVQDVFLELHRSMNRGLDLSKPVSPWLSTVAYRMARDFLVLARNREMPKSDVNESESAAPTPEDAVMEKLDFWEHLNRLLELLSPDQRAVLSMHDLDGFSMREIVECLGINSQTGYSRLHAARTIVQREWEKKKATPAVLPFALWGVGDLFAAAKRSTPELPDGFKDQVWSKLTARLGAAATAAIGFTARQAAALGVLAAVLGGVLGAGLHAAFTSAPTLAVAAVSVSAELPEVAAAPAVSAPPVSTPTAMVVASVSASSPPRAPRHADPNEGEKALIESARAAIASGELHKAERIMDEHERTYPRGLLARERDSLRAIIRAYQDGGQR